MARMFHCVTACKGWASCGLQAANVAVRVVKGFPSPAGRAAAFPWRLAEQLLDGMHRSERRAGRVPLPLQLTSTAEYGLL